MSDAMNGSAILAGNPAGEPAGNAGGTPPASNTPPAGNTNGDSGQSGNTWYDKFEDAELKGYVQNKGWKDPSELAVGYKNLEKLLGGEKLPMPKGADDAEGWGRVYDALGRPKSAEEYKLPLPTGDDGGFAKVASGWMHEAGLNQKQAEIIASKWNEYMQTANGNETQQSAAKVEADLTSLKGEWGQTWDENINLGQRAAKTFGLDADKLSAMENALGTGEMLKLMSRIGRGLTEHNFEGGNTPTGFGMTPAAAQERITALRNDPAWASKYMSGGADQQAEMRKLMAIAYPDQQ